MGKLFGWLNRSYTETIEAYNTRMNRLPLLHAGYVFFDWVNYDTAAHSYSVYIEWNGELNQKLQDAMPQGGYAFRCSQEQADCYTRENNGAPVYVKLHAKCGRLYVKHLYFNGADKQYELFFNGCDVIPPEMVCFWGRGPVEKMDDSLLMLQEPEDDVHKEKKAQSGSYRGISGSYRGIKGISGSYRTGSYRGIRGSYRSISGSYRAGSYRGIHGSYRSIGGSYRSLSGSYRSIWNSFLGMGSGYRGLYGSYRNLYGSYRGIGGSYRGISGSYRAGSYRSISGSYRAGSYRGIGGSYRSISGSYRRGAGSYHGMGGSSRPLKGSYVRLSEGEWDTVEYDVNEMVIYFPEADNMVDNTLGYGLDLIW